MIKHVVMYKLKDKNDKQMLVDKFLSMKGKIPQLIDLQSGSDVLLSERSFDVVLICTFNSLSDLEVYKNHPVHLPVMAFVKSIVEKSHSVDYEY